MGRCEVRARKGASPELRKATWIGAVVFAYAKSHKQFENAVKATLADAHLELVDLQDAGPAHELLDLDEDKFASAVETAETGTATLTLYTTDEPLDAVDEDSETIRTAAASGEAVQFRLIGGDYYHFGFVVEVRDTWALINKIDRNIVTFDGYVAVPFDRIFDAEIIDDTHRTFVTRALRHRGEEPRNPQVPLDGHRTLLTELSKRYPLVSLRMSRDPRNVYIGRITTIEEDRVTLRGVDAAGEWTGEHEHAYKEIEMILFATAYQAALASILE
jgi:hypothetical protein